MITAKVIWPPYPYKAGFSITDDTDAATFEQIETVYNFLLSRSFLTTKTVWPFLPSDKCGIPATPESTLKGITLQDTRYFEFCKMLHIKGFEICLHGASAGNNLRESTIKAFDFLKKEIGYSETFICHSKNADNIYWNNKITSLFPFHQLLKYSSNYECSGEISNSPYFWGDICQENVNQIRLYRTRNVNTLKKNPSMPYYCPDRPFVNGWFSATKRSLSDCAKKDELERLIAENGLTVLYQYLHRYASSDGRQLNKQFVEAIESILSFNSIKVDTVSHIMNRLRSIQGLIIFNENKVIWIVNTNQVPVKSLQIILDKKASLISDECKLEIIDKTINISEIPANSIIKLDSTHAIQIQSQRSYNTHGKRHISQKIPNGKIYLNLSNSDWQVSDKLQIRPKSFHLGAIQSGTGKFLLSNLTLLEESFLIIGQLWIVAREILFKGRSLNNKKFLDDSKEIKLENHDNW
jgi:hypothetical protein